MVSQVPDCEGPGKPMVGRIDRFLDLEPAVWVDARSDRAPSLRDSGLGHLCVFPTLKRGASKHCAYGARLIASNRADFELICE